VSLSGLLTAPIVMSEPHFYQAAATYQEAIDGLSPSADYQTFIDVEPVSQSLSLSFHLIIYFKRGLQIQ
jgi:hypothetical protein